MKRFGGIRHYLTILAAVATFGVGFIVAASPANAVTWPEICAQNGTGYCMNDWGGAGPVAMYSSGVFNDAYAFESIDPCNSTPAGRVTGTAARADSTWPTGTGRTTLARRSTSPHPA